MARIKIIGDSILKGTLYDDKTRRYVFSNYLRDIPDSENLSKFGMTVTKGFEYVKKYLEKDSSCQYLLMDYGGNDSDYYWEEISAAPKEEHASKTPISLFMETYANLINYVRSKGVVPVITTLCLIDGPSYFNYFCGTLNCNEDSVMQWLKYLGRIEETQRFYSEKVKELSEKENVPLIDIRLALEKSCWTDKRTLLCHDGIHVNEEGQKIIFSCINDYFMIH